MWGGGPNHPAGEEAPTIVNQSNIKNTTQRASFHSWTTNRMLSELKNSRKSVQMMAVRRLHAKNYIILGDDSQRQLIEESAGNKVFYFTASWCPPCKAIAPVFEKLSAENSQITFLKIDIDNFAEAASDYNIRSVPTFVFMQGKKKLSQVSMSGILYMATFLTDVVVFAVFRCE